MSDHCAACGELFAGRCKAFLVAEVEGRYDTDLCTQCAGDGLAWAAKMARSGAVQLLDKPGMKCPPTIFPPDGFVFKIVSEPGTYHVGVDGKMVDDKPEPEKPLPCPFCWAVPERLSEGGVYCATTGCPVSHSVCHDVGRWNRRAKP